MNTIDPNVDTQDRIRIPAKVGGALIGSMNFVGSLLGYFTVSNFGRVDCLYWCHWIMGLLWAGIGVCSLYDYNFLAVI